VTQIEVVELFGVYRFNTIMASSTTLYWLSAGLLLITVIHWKRPEI